MIELLNDIYRGRVIKKTPPKNDSTATSWLTTRPVASPTPGTVIYRRYEYIIPGKSTVTYCCDRQSMARRTGGWARRWPRAHRTAGSGNVPRKTRGGDADCCLRRRPSKRYGLFGVVAMVTDAAQRHREVAIRSSGCMCEA